MKLKDLILNNLGHYEVIEKLAESIRNDLINNQKLTTKEISELDNSLEVLKLGSNTRTLLGDYSNLETAIEEFLEQDLIPSINKNDLSWINEKNEILTNIESNQPVLAKKINEVVDTLSRKYENCKLLENRELYFYNGEFESNENESIILTSLFFTNNEYYMNYLHDQSEINFDLIENTNYIQKVFLLENIEKVKKLVQLNIDSMNDNNNSKIIYEKCSDIVEELNKECLMEYDIELEIDNFIPLGYGTSFLEKICENKINYKNLYDIEDQKNKDNFKKCYAR